MNIPPIQPQKTPRILQGCPGRSGSCLDHCQRNRGSSKLKTATFEWPCGLVTWGMQALYIIYCILYIVYYILYIIYSIVYFYIINMFYLLYNIMYVILYYVYVIIYMCVCDVQHVLRMRKALSRWAGLSRWYPRRSSLRQGQLKASTDLADRGCMSTTLRGLSPEPLEVYTIYIYCSRSWSSPETQMPILAPKGRSHGGHCSWSSGFLSYKLPSRAVTCISHHISRFQTACQGLQ